MFDFVAEHPWICLVLLIMIAIAAEFVFNRDNWKTRSAELTVTFVGAFAAIVFALAQGKYDREQEGKDKAITLFRAAEIELSAVMAEYDIFPPDDSVPIEKSLEKPQAYDGAIFARVMNKLMNSVKAKKAEEKYTKFSIFEAILKEPEVFSRFPDQIMLLLSYDYGEVQSLIRMTEIQSSAANPIYFDEPDDQEKEEAKEEKPYIAFLGASINKDLWQQFAGTKYTFCALRTSIEVEREFNDDDDDFYVWVDQLKKSCGNAEGLVNKGPGRLPYVEALVDRLKHGPR